MTTFENRAVVVTGGGSGIGRAVALAFAAEGARVVVIGRRSEPLDETRALAEATTGTIHPIPADICDEATVAEAFAKIDRHIGGCEILVNSAGAFGGGPVTELSVTDWKRVMDVNVTGMFLCSREAFRRMIPTGEGRIINIGSIAGERPRLHSTAYASSKFAVQGLTQALALEGREHGIAVGVLNPGNTKVERRDQGTTTTGVYGTKETEISPENIARTVLLMAGLDKTANMLEATVLPIAQPYLGRG